MDIQAEYRSRLTTPADAVASIRSGSKMAMSMAVAQPPALLKALADRAEAGSLEDLSLYYYEAMRTAAETVLRYELTDRIKPFVMFASAVDRALMKRSVEAGKKVVSYVPNNFSEASRLLVEEIGIESFITTVSPMDKHGYFTLGTSNDYSSVVARSAKNFIVEVNPQMPRVLGRGAAVHVSEVTAIVENDVPLLEVAKRAGSDADAKIGRIVADMVEDGSCMQMGVGALPNLVCANLMDRKDLGIHTEALCQGLIDLMQAGVVTGRRKTIDVRRSIYTFAMGEKAMYDFLDGNPFVESGPVAYVNKSENIAKNDKVVSINATLQVDLTGACNSEHLLGHQYTSSGGQVDFARGAFNSKGGKSIIACRSTAAKGKISRIVARLEGPVTTSRIDTHWIVTEFGAVNMKGRSSPERAKALISIAHPEFRDELTKSAKEMFLL